MEKQAAAPATAKSRYKLLKLLPKAATGLNFQNPPFSPGREKMISRADLSSANKLKTHMNKGFSAPIISIIPVEARNKSKNSGFDQAQDPTSPKVSCMGQIKHRKKLAKMKRAVSLHKDVKPSSSLSSPHESKTKKSSSFLRIFSSEKPGRSKSGVSAEKSSKLADHSAAAAPGLGQMKRFTSGRDSLGNFDWTKAQIAPDDDIDHHHRRYYSDEERGDSDREEEEEEEEIIIPFSAPLMVGEGGGAKINLEPRKEINIWKRRTMAQPRTLQLKASY